MLQCENESGISFVVHERVTNLPRLMELIKKNNGNIVDSITEAHFCLLSACRPDVTEAIAHVTREDGLPIDSSWIWESAAVGKLLPWYQYQLGLNRAPEMDDETRDLHELSTALARYSPITESSEAVYSHLALKFPHRRSSGFKELHKQNRGLVDSCVVHLKKQIEALAPTSGFFQLPLQNTTYSPTRSLPSSASDNMGESDLSTAFEMQEDNVSTTEMQNASPEIIGMASLEDQGSIQQVPSTFEESGDLLDPAPFFIDEQEFEDEDIKIPNSAPHQPHPAPVIPIPTSHKLSATVDLSIATKDATEAVLTTRHRKQTTSKLSAQFAMYSSIGLAGRTARKERQGIQTASDPSSPFSMRRKRGSIRTVTLPTTINAATNIAISVPHLYWLQRPKQELNPRRSDEIEDSYGENGVGQEDPPTPIVLSKKGATSKDMEMQDQANEEEVKRQRQRRKRKPVATQGEIDAMREWGRAHPVRNAENMKDYWSRFVAESEVGRGRSWGSWENLSRHHGRPPTLGIGEALANCVPQTTSTALLAASPEENPRIFLRLPPRRATGVTSNSAGIKLSPLPPIYSVVSVPADLEAGLYKSTGIPAAIVVGSLLPTLTASLGP